MLIFHTGTLPDVSEGSTCPRCRKQQMSCPARTCLFSASRIRSSQPSDTNQARVAIHTKWNNSPTGMSQAGHDCSRNIVSGCSPSNEKELQVIGNSNYNIHSPFLVSNQTLAKFVYSEKLSSKNYLLGSSPSLPNTVDTMI